MAQDVFELHVLQGGQWRVTEKFTHLEKETALASAKRLSATADAVKLVRESFDEEDGRFKQRTLYRYSRPGLVEPGSGSAIGVGPVTGPALTGGSRAAASRAGSMTGSPPLAGMSGPRRPAGGGLDLRLFVVPGLAALVAAVGALVTSGFNAASFSITGAQRDIVLLVAGGVFTVTALIAWLTSSRGGRAGSDGSAIAIFGPDGEIPAAPPPAKPPQPVHTAVPPTVPVAATGAQAATQPPAAVESPALEGVDAALRVNWSAEQMRTTLAQFLQDSLAEERMHARIGETGFAAWERFGAHLYLLGAADMLVTAARGAIGLPELLLPVLEPLGSTVALAQGFIARAEDYRQPPHYRQVIGAGHAAMRNLIGGQLVPEPTLYAALMAWNPRHKPRSPTGEDGPVAILFTDLVSWVQTTQRLGDAGAMTLLQAHNAIVAAALKRCRGFLVKHTGDGIMAAFADPGDSVIAAAQILSDADAHNRVTMAETLQIRIGVSAGPTIREDDDYFGSVVQRAARLCTVADGGEALVSDEIVEMAPGIARFGDRREVELKGFPNLQACRTLVWAVGGPTTDGALEKTGEDSYRLTMAVAGFTGDDLTIALDERSVTVIGAPHQGNGAGQFPSQDVIGRPFRRRFELEEAVRVIGADLAHGFLEVIMVTETAPSPGPYQVQISRIVNNAISTRDGNEAA